MARGFSLTPQPLLWRGLWQGPGDPVVRARGRPLEWGAVEGRQSLSVLHSHHRAKGKLSQQSVTPTRQANKEEITDQSINSRGQWWMQAWGPGLDQVNHSQRFTRPVTLHLEWQRSRGWQECLAMRSVIYWTNTMKGDTSPATNHYAKLEKEHVFT